MCTYGARSVWTTVLFRSTRLTERSAHHIRSPYYRNAIQSPNKKTIYNLEISDWRIWTTSRSGPERLYEARPRFMHKETGNSKQCQRSKYVILLIIGTSLHLVKIHTRSCKKILTWCFTLFRSIQYKLQPCRFAFAARVSSIHARARAWGAEIVQPAQWCQAEVRMWLHVRYVAIRGSSIHNGAL